MHHRKRSVLLLVLLFIVTAALVSYRSLRPANKLPYDLATVEKGILVQNVLAAGTINSEIAVQIGSQVSGIVKEIYVDYDTPVQKGELLALIDSDAFKAQLSQAESSLDNEKANLARQEANLLHSKALLKKADLQLNEAQTNVNRMRRLFNEGGISKSQLEAAVTSFYSARAEKTAQEALYAAELQALKAAQAQVAQCKGGVVLAKVNLSRTEIRSPIDGIVISRNVDIGQTVSASLQSPTLFVIAKDLTKMELFANVSEADIGNVKAGQKTTFKVDAYPERTFSGNVKEVRMMPTVMQNAVYYDAVIRVDNKELLLRPGMRAEVSIETIRKENVLLLPLTAIKENKNGKYVEVLDGDKIRQREVMTGLKGINGAMEIVSGLNAGERAIISRRKT